MDYKVVYLAAPYSNPDPTVTEARIEKFLDVDAALIEQGYVTVSPLSKHFILNRGRSIPGDWAYWKEYSCELLARCDKLLVMTCFPGWKDSTGIRGEVLFAIKKSIPISAVDEHGQVQGFDDELFTYIEDLVKEECNNG